MNISRKRNINFFDINVNQDFMSLKLAINDFQKIRGIVKKTGVKVKIQRRAGFPFFLATLIRRKAFLGGILFISACFFILSLFVWKIDIHISGELEQNHVMERLKGLGIARGMMKNKIDTAKLSEKMMVEFEDFSWVEVKIKGIRLEVFVSPKKKQPKIIPSNVPCNIIAIKDGSIKSTIVKAGTSKVKVGSTAKKGDILIEGVIVYKDGTKDTVHAIGDVFARTWYDAKELVYESYVEKVPTGKVSKTFYFKFNNKKIFFNKNNPYDKNYDTIDKDISGNIVGKIGFPFGFGIEEYYENELVEREIDYKIACKTAMEKAQKIALSKVPVGGTVVSQKEFFIKHDENTTYIEVLVECLEDIGTEQIIGTY